MKPVFTKPFLKSYQKLPEEIKAKFKKQLSFLLINPQHPSLRIKKIQGIRGLWEGRITRVHRFTFIKFEDYYLFRSIGKHEIIDKL